VTNQLEFRGKWTDIIWPVILIALAGIFTLGIAVPWAFISYRKKVFSLTYYRGSSMSYDGVGGEYFGQMIVGLLLTLVTIGFYALLGYYEVRLLKYDVEHTILPDGRRMQFRGQALDFFGQYLVIGILSTLTLGIYAFWGYARMRRFTLEHCYIDGKQLRFSGTGGQFLGISIVIFLLTLVTLGIYSFLGFSTVKTLRWDSENTLIPD